MHFSLLWDAVIQLSWQGTWGSNWCAYTSDHKTYSNLAFNFGGCVLSAFMSWFLWSNLSCYIKLLTDFLEHTHTHTQETRQKQNICFWTIWIRIFQIKLHLQKKLCRSFKQISSKLYKVFSPLSNSTNLLYEHFQLNEYKITASMPFSKNVRKKRTTVCQLSKTFPLLMIKWFSGKIVDITIK